MTDEQSHSFGERISRVETSVSSVHSELADIRDTLKEIAKNQSRSKETNWGVIFAGIAVAGSLYAAAIRPLEIESSRTQHEAGRIADAVLIQNERTGSIEKKLAIIEWELEHPKP